MKSCVVKKIFILCSVLSSLHLTAETFKLASWNILAEWAYLKNAQTKTMPFDATIDFEGRENLLWKNITKLSKKNIDIICLQEVDMRQQAAGPDIKILLENLGYAVVVPTKLSSQATLIAYNKKKFKGTNAYEITLTPAQGKSKKQCSTVTLSSIKNPSLPSLKIISLHLPFESEHDELNNLHNNVIKKHANTQGFTIICGDFNYTTYSTNTNDSVFNYDNLIDAQHFFAQFWDDAGLQHGFQKTGTAYSQAFKRMDYIFYTTTYNNTSLTCTDYRQAPKDLKRLIKHTAPMNEDEEGAAFSDFPSDHALLIAEFKLKDTSKKPKKVVKTDKITKLGHALTSLGV